MNSTIPADLLEIKARFETWRTNRKYVREPIPPQIINVTISNLYIQPILKFYVDKGFSYSQPITISGSTIVGPRAGTQQGARLPAVSRLSQRNNAHFITSS
jgi:hypothetical protein